MRSTADSHLVHQRAGQRLEHRHLFDDVLLLGVAPGGVVE